MLSESQLLHYISSAFMYVDLKRSYTPVLLHGGFYTTFDMQLSLQTRCGIKTTRKYIQCLRHVVGHRLVCSRYILEVHGFASTYLLLLIPDHMLLFPSTVRFKKYIEGLYAILDHEDQRCTTHSKGDTFPFVYDHSTGSIIPYTDEDLVNLFNHRVETSTKGRKKHTAKEFERILQEAQADAKRKSNSTDNDE